MNELTVVERAKLENYETVIERGLKSFIEVGNALLEIREGKLYRESHDSFSDYLRDRWQMGKSRAYQLINASSVAENVHNCGQNYPSLTSESQARELAKLSAEQQAEAWERAVETAPKDDDGQPVVTASHIRHTIDPPENAKRQKAKKSEFDQVVERFEKLPARSKHAAIKRMRLDDDVVEKTLREEKRAQTANAADQSFTVAFDALHGFVQAFPTSARLARLNDQQRSHLKTMFSRLRNKLGAVEQTLREGGIME